MTVLFIGESGEIQSAVQTVIESRVAMQTCGFDRFSAIDQIVEPDIYLYIVAAENPDQIERVSPVLQCAAQKRIPAVVFACEPSGSKVLEWLKLGAAAVDLWPRETSRIGFLIDSLTVVPQAQRQAKAEKDLPDSTSNADGLLVSASPTMQHLVDQAQRIASLDVNVLLSGETGVGKTRLARLLHDQSHRKELPFFAVNCGALPENLLESELFGHRRGAFTGADADRKGRFQEVGKGTLFLDEVDSIPHSSQCKLLRAIENRVFEPLGSNKSIAFQGRLLAASNSQLERLIEKELFRADLFYRIGVMELYIPPLRERREDIRPIADATLREYTGRNALPARSISQEVVEILEAYSWPGNIRQLKNVIESSASLCHGDQIEVTDLSGRWLSEVQKSRAFQKTSTQEVHSREVATGGMHLGRQDCSLAESREKLEADRILRVLREVGNNRTRAAIRLGISRSMLYKKIAKYNLGGRGGMSHV